MKYSSTARWLRSKQGRTRTKNKYKACINRLSTRAHITGSGTITNPFVITSIEAIIDPRITPKMYKLAPRQDTP